MTKITSPDFWNVNYDGIMREDMPEGTFLVGYVDDMESVIRARNTKQAQQKKKVGFPRPRPGLQKTESTSRHILLQLDISIGNEVI